ncbi:MAG: lipocalin family protein [Desulfobacterales bacterium]
MKMNRCMLAMLLALAFVVPSCETSKPVVEADYAAKIVGDWVGTVDDEKESITFRADGGFEAQLRPSGFISNTLSQGVTGTIRGTWAISGKTITLKITSTEDERVKNSSASSTILAFSTNELEMKSDRGETSKFVRAIPL